MHGIQQLNAKKLELTQQRDAAIAQMQAASDQSAVQKQQAIITALNGAIAIAKGVPFKSLYLIPGNANRVPPLEFGSADTSTTLCLVP